MVLSSLLSLISSHHKFLLLYFLTFKLKLSKAFLQQTARSRADVRGAAARRRRGWSGRNLGAQCVPLTIVRKCLRGKTDPADLFGRGKRNLRVRIVRQR